MVAHLSITGAAEADPSAPVQLHPLTTPAAIVQACPPTLTAKQLLDLPLPNINIIHQGGPQESSRLNELFSPPETLLWDQAQSCFGDLGGYPNHIFPAGPQHLFWPLNEVDDGDILAEAQAVEAGRKYILGPVSSIIRRKFTNHKYHVEYDVRGSIPDPPPFTPSVTPILAKRRQKLSGHVDAAWSVFENGDRTAYAFCEFKRTDSLRDTLWRTHTGHLTEAALGVMRQVLKYAWCTNKRYFILCSWDRTLFIKIPHELPLEGFTFYWQRKKQLPAGFQMPNAYRSPTGQGQGTPLGPPVNNKGWRNSPIQAFLSTDRTRFKLQFYAFICKAFNERHLPIGEFEPRGYDYQP